MKTELLQKVLESEPGVRLEGKSNYLVGDDVDLTIHIEMGHEALSIARVRRVNISSEVLLFETHKNERFYVGGDTGVRALKFAPNDSGKKASTGFAGQR
jgi:hypothetical protein